MEPAGIWSDGTDMWVLYDHVNEYLVAYDLATARLDRNRVFNTEDRAWDNRTPAPYDLWSDGTNLWVVDHTRCLIFAFDRITGANRPDLTIRAEHSNGRGCLRARTTGIWSDRETMWVAYEYPGKILAYSLATGARQSQHDITTLGAAGVNRPAALWSDGVTLWVANSSDTRVYAFGLADGVQRSDLEFSTEVLQAADVSSLNGIWSDGATMWVSDIGRRSQNTPHYAAGTGEPGIHAFAMPISAALKSLTISNVDFGLFQTGVMSYSGTAPSGTTSATVAATAAFPDDTTVAVSYEAADGTQGTGTTVTLSQGANTITITIAYGTSDIRTYTVTVTVPDAG